MQVSTPRRMIPGEVLATLSNWREPPKACRTNPCREICRGPVVTTQGMVRDDMDSSALCREDGQSAAKPLSSAGIGGTFTD